MPYRVAAFEISSLILSCVSPENFYENLEEVKNLGVPFGFKLNAFVTTNPKDGYTNSYNVSKTGNPNEFLGQRKDLTPELMANCSRRWVSIRGSRP